jgi:hypothetical protein
MTSNLNAMIERIKENAVARCRERIEIAADKAREVLNKKKNGEPKDNPPKAEVRSVTSAMKRQHGL